MSLVDQNPHHFFLLFHFVEGKMALLQGEFGAILLIIVYLFNIYNVLF